MDSDKHSGLDRQKLEQLLSFAERGYSTVVSSLAQQPGQAAEIERVSKIARELFQAVVIELEDWPVEKE